jgi:putative acetyltransferase
MEIKFRKVRTQDHELTRDLVYEAFKGHEPEETAVFLDALRADTCILGEWLAEDASGAIGHIVFSRVWVERPDGSRVSAAMLTPLAVRSDRQRSGLGTQLMAVALGALEAEGEQLFFVLGHPGYYPRVGFRSDLTATIESPWHNEPAFMVRGRTVPAGRLILPKSIAAAH